MKGSDAKVVELIYDAALAPQRWPVVLGAVADHLGFSGGMFFQKDNATSAIEFVEFHGFDAAAIASYRRHYSAVSPWMPVAMRLQCEIFVPCRYVPPKRLEKSEFYNDWLRPQEFYDAIGGVVHREPGAITMFSLIRERRAGFVDTAIERRFRAVLPHIRTAVEMHRRLHRAKLAQDGALAALDRLQVAVVLAGNRGRILFANRKAEAILRRSDGLIDSCGCLGATSEADDRGLRRAIDDATATTEGRSGTSGNTFELRRSDGTTLEITVSPAPRTGVGEATALVFIVDRAEAGSSIGRLLEERYRLTGAEQRLLRALLEGKRLREHAGLASVSLNTAKTQLQQIFYKTGTHRQADLLRLVDELRSRLPVAELRQ